MNNKILLLSVSFVWLNVLDIFTTWVMLQLGGKETNFFLHSINQTGITFSIIVFKIGIPLVLGIAFLFMFRYAEKKKSRLAIALNYGALLAINIFFIFVIINNIRMLNFQIQEVLRRVYE